MIERREFAKGVAVLQDAFEASDRTGWRPTYPEFKGALALGLAGLGHPGEALGVVAEAIGSAGDGEDGQLWFLPELLRIKGELLLQHAADRALPAAEDCFDRANEIAGKHGACSGSCGSPSALLA